MSDDTDYDEETGPDMYEIDPYDYDREGPILHRLADMKGDRHPHDWSLDRWMDEVIGDAEKLKMASPRQMDNYSKWIAHLREQCEECGINYEAALLVLVPLGPDDE
jgi:hypothetical protein